MKHQQKLKAFALAILAGSLMLPTLASAHGHRGHWEYHEGGHLGHPAPPPRHHKWHRGHGKPRRCGPIYDNRPPRWRGIYNELRPYAHGKRGLTVIYRGRWD